MTDNPKEREELRSKMLQKVARQMVAFKEPYGKRTNGDLNEDAHFIRRGNYFQNIEQLIDTYCKQQVAEARVDELKTVAQFFLGDPRKTIKKDDLRFYIINALAELNQAEEL